MRFTLIMFLLLSCRHTSRVLHPTDEVHCPAGFTDMSGVNFSLAIDHERDGPRMSYIMPSEDGTLHNIECAVEKGRVDQTKCCDQGMLVLVTK